MNSHSFIFILLICLPFFAGAQDRDYIKSIESYQKRYVKDHEVVKGKDKEQVHFFPIAEEYRITATVERIYEAPWFKMQTSAKTYKTYRVYAIVHFSLNDTALKLNVYQSQDLMSSKEYARYLFIPFTDKTSGEESYDNGRYIDLTMDDLEPGNFVIDFNKAYNPYCAYVSNQYSCPIPPKENDVKVAIRAGEMKYGKGH
jgi:uncharacterized protein